MYLPTLENVSRAGKSVEEVGLCSWNPAVVGRGIVLDPKEALLGIFLA